MPEIRYEKVAPNVRRARHYETPQEVAQRQLLEEARAILARQDALPPEATPIERLLWERLRAVEILLHSV